MVSNMIGCTARVWIKPGKEADFEAVAREMVDAVRAKEPGNIFYSLFRTERPGEYVFIERWQDREAEKAHQAADHVKVLIPRFMECMARDVEMTIYEEIPQAG